ncbi:MAG: hypothetical protein N2053_02685 [Chitinispirillaceae bacterium]|nr:hypothetical protein [Chitinispirillaceae bacterium]
MSIQLRNYLKEAYEEKRSSYLRYKIDTNFPIQIDDQDDKDNINEICNIFCTVKKKDNFILELCGSLPITQEIIDLVEIYGGKVDLSEKSITLPLNILQIDAVTELANRLKKTSNMGDTINNPNWFFICARTISSLYRFVRIIKEYNQNQSRKNLLS